MASAKSKSPAICTPKQLPQGMQLAAAKTAIMTNPANAPPMELMAMAAIAITGDEEPRPNFLAFITSRYWGSTGVDLSVSFLDNPTAGFRNKWLAHANSWNTEAGGNVRFRWSQSGGQVRVDRARRSGYWSYLGTDITHIRPGEPTMNLDSFTESTSDSEWRRVVRHEVGHCLAGDTLIDCPRDLEKHPKGIPILELVGKTPWVYAWKDGQVVVRQASRVWLSRRAVPTVRVQLGTGQGGKSTRTFLPPLELVGTPDHPVLLADGVTWRNLGDLKPGDRLCSLYRDKNGTRSRIRWTGADRVREHVFIAEQVYGPRPANCHAHHKNARQMDQTPGNLEWKDAHAHHSDHGRGRIDSEETKRRRSEAQRRRMPPTPETRAKMSLAQKSRPPASPETREKISAASRGKKQSEELVAKRAAAMRRFYDNGGRSGMYGKKATEETRMKQSVAAKECRRKKRETATNHTVKTVSRLFVVQDVYDMTVPDADSFIANGVVVHNSLGCPHEHLRRELVERLDVQKTIDYFRRTQGWSEQDVRYQVLTPIEERLLLATEHADEDSIMCYQLPGAITRDGQPIPGGNDFSTADKALAAKVYPLTVQPPPGGGNRKIITVTGTDFAIKVADG